MKSLKALDATSNDGMLETPRSTTGRHNNIQKRFSMPPDNKQIVIQENNDDFYFEEEPAADNLERVIRKRFPLDSTKHEFELGQLIIPMSVNRFFEQFIADGAAFGHDIFCSEVLHNTEIQTELLVRSDQDENGQALVRNMNMVTPIEGVPFCNSSRSQKKITVSRPKK